MPQLTSLRPREGARDYTRVFFRSHRDGVPLRRQVAPLDLEFDRFGQVESFRRATWQRLYDKALARPANPQSRGVRAPRRRDRTGPAGHVRLSALGFPGRDHRSWAERPGTYRLSFSANINYGSTLLFRHDYQTAEQLTALVSRSQFESGNFDPNSRKDPHSLLMGDKELWGKLGSFPVTRTVNESLLASVAALVQAKLVLLQRAFYAEVSQRMVRAGDPIQSAGNVVNGVKLLWRAMVTAGLPLSIEANEILRSLLFGRDAILAGSDADGQDSQLDDVQDLYAFFNGRPEDPPPTNIAPLIATLAAGRLQRLSDLLAEIVKNIEENGEPEPPDVFAPTLLRLRLLLPN